MPLLRDRLLRHRHPRFHLARRHLPLLPLHQSPPDPSHRHRYRPRQDRHLPSTSAFTAAANATSTTAATALSTIAHATSAFTAASVAVSAATPLSPTASLAARRPAGLSCLTTPSALTNTSASITNAAATAIDVAFPSVARATLACEPTGVHREPGARLCWTG